MKSKWHRDEEDGTDSRKSRKNQAVANLLSDGIARLGPESNKKTMEDARKLLLDAEDDTAPGTPICLVPLKACLDAWMKGSRYYAFPATQDGHKGEKALIEEMLLFVEREGGRPKTLAGLLVRLPSTPGEAHTGILTSLWTKNLHTEPLVEKQSDPYSRANESVDRIRRAAGKVTDAVLRVGGSVLLGHDAEVRVGMKEEAAKKALEQLHYDVFASETGDKGVFFARCNPPREDMLIPLEKEHVEPGIVIVQKHMRGEVIRKDSMGGISDWVVRWMDGSDERSEKLFGKGALVSLHAEVKAWEEEGEEGE